MVPDVELPPATPFTDHATPMFWSSPVTCALNACVWPAPTATTLGVTPTVTSGVVGVVGELFEELEHPASTAIRHTNNPAIHRFDPIYESPLLRRLKRFVASSLVPSEFNL